MKQENVNIHSHIIKEDYESKKKKPPHWDISDKPILLSELKNNTTLVEQFKKMHNDFIEPEDPELPQINTSDSDKIESQSNCQSTDSQDITELIKSYQELKNDEQELIDERKSLLIMEQDLRNRLIQEVSKKRKVVKELQDEISALQSTCREINQEIDI
jgi:regulator of replication initiation timing